MQSRAEERAHTRVCNFTWLQQWWCTGMLYGALLLEQSASRRMNKILINVMQQFSSDCSRSCNTSLLASVLLQEESSGLRWLLH